MRRRSSHSSVGTIAMAITKAVVTGRKNSAPARKRERQRQRQPDAEHQDQSGEQPVAAIGDRFELHLDRGLGRGVLRRLMRAVDHRAPTMPQRGRGGKTIRSPCSQTGLRMSGDILT